MYIDKCILCGIFQASNLSEFEHHLKLIHGAKTKKQVYLPIVYIHFLTDEEMANIQSIVSERIEELNRKYVRRTENKVDKGKKPTTSSVSGIEIRKALEKILDDSDDDNIDNKNIVSSIQRKLTEDLESSDEEENDGNGNSKIPHNSEKENLHISYILSFK